MALTRIFRPITIEEARPMGSAHTDVAGAQAFGIELERRRYAFAGLLPNGKPFFPLRFPIFNAVHAFYPASASRSGQGREQGKEILSFGVGRLPGMSLPYAPEMLEAGLGPKQPEREDKKEKKHLWL